MMSHRREIPAAEVIGPSRTHVAGALLLLVALGGLRPAPVRASPLLELVGDSMGQGGLSPRGSSHGAAASYFNPALLTTARDGLSLGFFVLSQQVRVLALARASSPLCPNHACDVPAVNDAGPAAFRRADNSALPSPALPTAWLQDGLTAADGHQAIAPRPRQQAGTGQQSHQYLAVGLVQHVWEQRIALGVYSMLPSGDILRANAFYSDEREQFFSNSLHPELYGDRLSAAAFVFGAGVQLSDALSLGAGLTIAMQSAAQAPVYISNLSDLDSLLLDSDVHGTVALAPHVGLTFAPIERLHLSFTAHSPQATEIETRFSYIVATGLEQRAHQNFTHSALPWTFALGAELGLGDEAEPDWSLAAGITYALWSKYRDRHGQQPLAPYAWGNAASASVGVRHNGPVVRGFVDLGYAPTPVPLQSGRSNYVDNDRASVALGASYTFTPWGMPLEVGASAQFHALLARTAVKLADQLIDEVPDDAVGGTPRGPVPGREGLQTNNPGFPGFTSDGLLWAAGIHTNLGF